MKSWISTLTAVTLCVAGLGLPAASALAQDGATTTPADLQQKRVDKRQARQHDRIAQGVSSGELTVRERARLAKQQRHVRQLERRTEADGQVTAKEAVRMEKAQDHASQQIYRQKHDEQQRGN
jgi:UDP-N-acetyl-D-mannosaminuronate dehydrogenase